MKDDTPFILECPSCRTRYEIPVSIPDGGRKVRCANCAHIWMAQPEDTFRMGEEPPPEEAIREEVVFREDEDESDGHPPAERPEQATGEDAQSAVDAAFDADGDFNANPESREDEDQSDPQAFAAAVAEAGERAETTGAFTHAEDDTGFDDDKDAASPSEAEAESGEQFARAEASSADEPTDEDRQADEVAAFYGDIVAKEADVPQDDVPQDSASEQVFVGRPKRREKDFRSGIAAGWGLLVLAVAAIGYLAVAQRVEVVRLMPGSATLYEAVGLPVNTRGLDFRDVAYSWETDGGQVVLEVHGDIVNLTSQPMEIPSLVLGLRDDSNTEVYQWEEAVMNAPLGAGESATFAVRIPTPPKSIKSVQVRFARVR